MVHSKSIFYLLQDGCKGAGYPSSIAGMALGAKDLKAM